jgi:hypothetical protein
MEADYRRLKAGWKRGSSNREEALHLLFLAWMHWADPPFVTGLEDDPDVYELWRTIYAHFGGAHSEDTEFLYVAALMADHFPYMLGDEQEWLLRAQEMEKRFLHFKPERFSPDFFEGRGDYGEYFAHQSRGQ